jgi:DNA-binding transcriptional regulator GbsR (MarR family)
MVKPASDQLDDPPIATGYGRQSTFDIQLEFIDVFVHLANVIGVPRSVGEIYGFVFSSADPVAFEEVVSGLRISNGSASRGLRILRAIGAVTTTYIAGDRRDFYLAETDLRKLGGGVFKALLEDRLLNGESRLVRLADRISALQNTPPTTRQFLEERVSRLRCWHGRAKVAVPAVLDILESHAAVAGDSDELGTSSGTERRTPDRRSQKRNGDPFY